MFDTEDTYWRAASALLGRRGQVYTDELCNAVMGRPPRYCFEFFKETFGFPETWQELQRESEDLFLEFLDDGFSTMPGLYELLEHLEQRNIPRGRGDVVFTPYGRPDQFRIRSNQKALTPSIIDTGSPRGRGRRNPNE